MKGFPITLKITLIDGISTEIQWKLPQYVYVDKQYKQERYIRNAMIKIASDGFTVSEPDNDFHDILRYYPPNQIKNIDFDFTEFYASKSKESLEE